METEILARIQFAFTIAFIYKAKMKPFWWLIPE